MALREESLPPGATAARCECTGQLRGGGLAGDARDGGAAQRVPLSFLHGRKEKEAASRRVSVCTRRSSLDYNAVSSLHRLLPARSWRRTESAPDIEPSPSSESPDTLTEKQRSRGA